MERTSVKSAARTGRLGRRRFSQLLAGTGLALVCGPMVSGRGFAASEASYYTWGGYDDPAFDQPYIDRHGASPHYSTFPEDESAFQKLRVGGLGFEISHPCAYEVSRWREAGLLQPVDVSRIEHWNDLFPALKNQPGMVADGQNWFVPWDWGNTSITYRADLVSIEEESWALLWDERYEGRLSLLDTIADPIVAAAVLSGIDPFTMTPEQVAVVKAKLAEQKPLIRFYTSDVTSVEQALATGELVAAMTWNSSYAQLRQQGVPVKFMRPKEGLITWVCGFVLLKEAPNLDKAYDFLNGRLDPRSGSRLISAYSYGAANRRAFELVSNELLEDLALPRNPTDLLGSSIVLRPMENRDLIAKAIEEVKLGI